MYITKENIQMLADNLFEYNKGEAYYDEGRVEDIQIETKDNGIEITAQVSGLMGDYKVNVDLYDEKITWHKCDCLDSFRQNGLCKHMVAMLLKYHYEIMSQVKGGIKGERYSQNALNFYEDQLVKD